MQNWNCCTVVQTDSSTDRIGYPGTSLGQLYCKESTLSDNIWWHQPWRQGVPRSAILEEGGE
eukprot:COSAG01_NODE_39422_length_476_cov_15.228117_1_plen_61_part_01